MIWRVSHWRAGRQTVAGGRLRAAVLRRLQDHHCPRPTWRRRLRATGRTAAVAQVLAAAAGWAGRDSLSKWIEHLLQSWILGLSFFISCFCLEPPMGAFIFYSHNILLWVSLTSGASEWSSLLDFHFRDTPRETHGVVIVWFCGCCF